MNVLRTAAASGAVAVLLLAGCASTSSESGAGGENDVTIGFVPGLASDPFFLSMERGAQAEADELGVELIWQGSPNEWSPESQIPFVDTVLASGIDAFILNPTDPVSLQASVDRAHDQGLPVIMVDQSVDDRTNVASFITGDNVAGGRAAAEEMVEQIGGEGQVFILGSAPADLTNRLRVQGFEEVIEDNTDVEIVGIEYQNSSSERATSIINTILLANPELDGIFAVNGTGTTGAAAAVRNNGVAGDVKLIGYDAYTAAVDELREGTVTALVAQQPGEQGRLAVRYAHALITGEGEAEVQDEVIIENVVLTEANLSENEQYIYED